ncbi:S-protein homolog 5-like, partial [Cicer arietinum]|uniref:S-protein homolog n=1 Tax=Cicer arietinum TaxID=3827 RepID=A0A1S2Z8G6_CICAR
LLSVHNVLGIRVSITNTLENNKVLTVHCKSADDDLGVRVLAFNDGFDWSFRKNFFGTTQFYCSFKWEGEFHWFDIYVAFRDPCSECKWVISQKGPIRVTSRAAYSWPWNK